MKKPYQQFVYMYFVMFYESDKYIEDGSNPITPVQPLYTALSVGKQKVKFFYPFLVKSTLISQN